MSDSNKRPQLMLMEIKRPMILVKVTPAKPISPLEQNKTRLKTNGGIPQETSCITAEENASIADDPEIRVLQQPVSVTTFFTENCAPILVPMFLCIYRCKFKSPSFNKMKLHVMAEHKPPDQDNYTCEACKFKTIWANTFVNHMICAHCVTYHCMLCDTGLPNNAIENHFQSVTHKCRIMKSEVCNFITTNPYALKKHRYTHCFNKEVVCHRCSWVISNHKLKKAVDFVDHNRMSPDQPNAPHLRCTWCEFTTFNYSLLENHMNLQIELHFHQCPACRSNFKSLDFLVNSHFDTCQDLNKVLSSDEMFKQFRQEKSINPTVILEAVNYSCKSLGAKTSMDLLVTVTPMKVMAECMVLEGKICRMCKLQLHSDMDAWNHFQVHFTPCCKSCSKSFPSVYCKEHAKWNYLISDKYYDNFTQHSFVKDTDQLMHCQHCALAVTHIQLIELISTIRKCNECSFLITENYHVLQHLLWKKSRSCQFSPQIEKAIYWNCKKRRCSCNRELADWYARLFQCETLDMSKLSHGQQSANICKLFTSTLCSICSIKLHSFKTLETHTKNQAIYMCHLCGDVVRKVSQHYAAKHPNLETNWTELAKLGPYISRHSDLFESLFLCNFSKGDKRTNFLLNGYCMFCRVKILVEDRGESQHWNLHMTPCCRDCTTLKTRKCEAHSKPLFFHPLFYLHKVTQHNFVKKEGYNYECDKCGFSIDEATGGKLLSTFTRCPSCDLNVLISNKRDATGLVVHVMQQHFAVKSCKVQLCENRFQCAEDLHAHYAEAHLDLLKCSLCSLPFPSVSTLLQHAAACKASTLNAYFSSRDLNGACTAPKLMIRARCHWCNVFHETPDETQFFHPRHVCPLCYKVLLHDEFEEHLNINHREFIAQLADHLSNGVPPEEFLKITKEAWELQLAQLYSLPERKILEIREIGENKETETDCTKYKVTAEEYEHVVHLTFQKE
ncbi:Hypothetical predicted protein [Cloeon dipterum]|uniref:C2H2-type domain-containing protein n=1 Tax=Cloeon dipterum TaxID=197152 RepID=A0A8S1D3S4_9INSE|nr:Hypothetical predicted protein [Cloeon dipterum]